MSVDFEKTVIELRKFINTWQHPNGHELSIDPSDVPANEAFVMLQDAAKCFGMKIDIELGRGF